MLRNFSLYCNCKHNVLRININHTYLRGPVPKRETTFLKFHINITFIFFIYLFIYLGVVCLTPSYHLNYIRSSSAMSSTVHASQQLYPNLRQAAAYSSQ